MKTATPKSPPRSKQCQRGAALLIAMLVVVLGLVTLLTFRSERKGPELEAERKTALALAQAKEALLGYAAKDDNRPGSLPCSDIDDDGTAATAGADLSCSAAATANLVARLPWKLLGLPDLRDGSGERLWYANTPDFRASVSSPLNTTNRGQITIRNAAGTIVNDATASPSAGVIAVIIAPGGVLARQGAGLTQDRSCTGGGGCTPQLICQSPYQSVAKCNPANYLDIVAGVEDNAEYVSPATANGFISGPVRDAAGVTLANDRLITITARELFTVTTFRMARELAKANGIYPLSATAISGLMKPAVWAENNWDIAIEGDGTTSNVMPGKITLKFLNCAITYTITGPSSVSRDRNSC